MSARCFQQRLHVRILGFALAACSVGVIFWTCREVDPLQKRFAAKSAAIAGKQQEAGAFDTLEIFASILGLEDSIVVNPRDTALRSRLLSYCVDTAAGCFYTVGKATYNPEFPESARRRAMQSAASAVAKRWALYVKAWHTSATIPFGAPIAGDIAYSQVLHEEEIGDTLFRMLMIPIGSVAIK